MNLEGAVLMDFSAISTTFGKDGLQQMFDKMTARFPNRQFYRVTFPEGVTGKDPFEAGPAICMNDIYEYVDAMASCYAVICTEAGAQALAAAVRGEHDCYDLSVRPEICAIIQPMTYNSRVYTFRGVDYRVTVHANNLHDYFTTDGSLGPPEVPYGRYQLMCRRTVEMARSAWEAARAKRAASV